MMNEKMGEYMNLTTKGLVLGLLAVFQSTAFDRSPIDLTLVGRIVHASGLGRIGVGIIDLFKDEFAINHNTDKRSENSNKDILPEVLKVAKNPIKTRGNVALCYYPVWMKKSQPYRYVPSGSHIKIAYSVFESTRIPEMWVPIMNERFDAVVVPDPWLVDAHISSGVTVPIFMVPHGIDLEEFLVQPEKEKISDHFVFGCSAAFQKRKNQEVLIKAFSEEFKDDPHVELHLHGRSRDKHYFKRLKKQIEQGGSDRIKVLYLAFSKDDYMAFMKSLDCYVLLSKSEGFSVTPREALALGIPTIINNNTAHKTICQTGFVYPVPSEIQEDAAYASKFGFGACGHNFNCTVEDARKALREVYENYQLYKEKARQGRKWVEKYLWQNLKDEFRALIKPYKVVLGDSNTLSQGCLTTNSPELYTKYCELIDQSTDC